MSRIAYVNGQYLPHNKAAVHIEDRGFQFADGVYEVCAVLDGCLLDEAPHLDRLERSLHELKMSLPVSRAALKLVLRETIRRNRVHNGLVYLQITRGAARRDHAFPNDTVPMSIVVTARSTNVEALDRNAEAGVGVKTMSDIRWGRCDIKTVGLLANVLAKQEAREQGCYEAWLVNGAGEVMEGSSTTAWIVDQDGCLITRPLDEHILPGVTRAIIREIASQEGLAFEERSFTVEEAKRAREAFITAASAWVTPVVEIDSTVIGNGKPGSISLALRTAYKAESLKRARSESNQKTETKIS